MNREDWKMLAELVIVLLPVYAAMVLLLYLGGVL